MLEIVPLHYIVSKKVRGFKEIQESAHKMMELLENGEFKGYYPKGYALAHAQVTFNPSAFFVVLRDLVKKGYFEHTVIMNPQILDSALYKPVKESDVQIGLPREFQEPNALSCTEGCLSLPHRRAKSITRYDRIKVTYQIPGGLFGKKRITKWLTGLPSQIFQHEYDHTQGKNIYFDKPKV